MQANSAISIYSFGAVDGTCHSAPNLERGQGCRQHNFRLTADKKLRRRQGYQPLCTLPAGACGFCYGALTPAQPPALYYCTAQDLCVYEEETDTHRTLAPLGHLFATEPTLFLYRNRLYLLCDGFYLCYDGQAMTEVEGYIPLRYTDTVPFSGQGQEKEAVNALTRYARVLYSPTEQSSVFLLPERAASVRWVKAYGKEVPYAVSYGIQNSERLQVNLETAVGADVGSVEICYLLEGEGRRAQILENNQVYRYGGSDDLRLFFYGNPQGRVDYSVSLTQSVHAAEYFPEYGHFTVGTGSGAVSGILRRYNHLIVHTAQETFAVTKTAQEYRVYLVDAQVGRIPQTPLAAYGKDSFVLSSAGLMRLPTASLSEERAECLSRRIARFCDTQTLLQSRCAQNAKEHEFWFDTGSVMWVYRYDCDGWYTFDSPHAERFLALGEAVGFLREGILYRYAEQADNDTDLDTEGACVSRPICASFESAPVSVIHSPLAQAGVWAYAKEAEQPLTLTLTMTDCTGKAECVSVQSVATQEGLCTLPLFSSCALGAGQTLSFCLKTTADVTVNALFVRLQGGRFSEEKGARR